MSRKKAECEVRSGFWILLRPQAPRKRRKAKGKTKALASKKKKARPRKMSEAERWRKDPYLRQFTV